MLDLKNYSIKGLTEMHHSTQDPFLRSNLERK